MSASRPPTDRALAAVLLCALALSGCAGGRHWQKPDSTPEELTSDISACERQADRLAEDEAFASRGGPNTAVIEVDRLRNKTRDIQGTARRNANLTEKARRAALFRDCMVHRGYRPSAD